jgi:hypothetical protein
MLRMIGRGAGGRAEVLGAEGRCPEALAAGAERRRWEQREAGPKRREQVDFLPSQLMMEGQSCW